MSTLNKILIAVMLLAITLFIAAGCGPTPQQPGQPNQPGVPASTQGTYVSQPSFNPKATISAQNFQSPTEYNNFIKGYGSSGGGYGRTDMMYDAVQAPMMGKVAAGAEASSSGGAPNTAPAPNDFSQTNNQVATVDEADLIKTDGNYIYTISGNTVYIIKAYPGEDAAITSKIVFNNSNPSNIFISGDHLAVFGYFYDNNYFKMMNIRPRNGMTFFNVYDISDKANPTLAKDYKLEGSYLDARMKDGYVYLVTNNYPESRPEPMPYLFSGGVKMVMPIDTVHFYNIPYRSPSMVTVSSVNLNSLSDEVKSESLVVEGGENVYMSDSNIYLSYTEYINEYELRQDIMKEKVAGKLSDTDRALIEKIKATDNDVLSQYEKDSKILQVYYDYVNYLTQDEQDSLNADIDKALEAKMKEYEHLEYTVINKVSVNKGDITVGETGKVPGHIINQFSLDEEKGVLRIATTISARWSYSYAAKESSSTKSTNNVYTLDSGLKQLGKLEGLAEDESIYSTRFIGDKLYMVTFRQVDPLFVIDLSDTANPKSLGQLKVPGFSRYLHPYDENTIIGIGNDATDQGRVQGLKISLFDVSDFEHPKEIAKFVTTEKYATSTALYEHKAFLFSKDKELLVIPAYSYDYSSYGGTGNGYNGAFVFKINKNEITLRGLIDHSQGSNTPYYGAEVERSLYINELLYTKSQGLLRINKISDLSSVKSITLGSVVTDIPVY